MVVRSLDINKDDFRPREENKKQLCFEIPYLSAIGALMYLANNTRPDIAFVVNLLARFSSSPTQRHWNGVKHVFRYFQRTIDLGLFYSNKISPKLIESCGISSRERVPTPLYEDNVTCMAHLKERYIKEDRTKHILPKVFFTHELQKRGDIDVQQIRSCDNLADLFTNKLLISTFEK
ncbi:hypothetical protein M9H77_06162 [Catharanthus roseus]|uniref:Uncharacterized protein n=1 Tax=Catharanthus roseus TaxID=4058 RepID=A0ACC0BRJ1_CATRO|nr:hypothetical protein M9H77_06162 [Catharanthus roseus]